MWDLLCVRLHSSATVLLGDMELETVKSQRALIESDFLEANVAVVLIPHHGSKSSNLLWLDEKICRDDQEAMLVVSYGEKNAYGHPHFHHNDDEKQATSEVLRACIFIGRILKTATFYPLWKCATMAALPIIFHLLYPTR